MRQVVRAGVVAVLLLMGSATAQPAQVRVELRSGPTIEAAVERVEPWGLVVSSEGNGIMFRHMLTLRTASDSLTGLVAEQLPGVPTRRDGDQWVLDVAALALPLSTAHPEVARVRVQPFLAAAAGASVGIESGFAVTTPVTGRWVLSVSHLARWLPSDGRYLGGVALGADFGVPTPAATVSLGGQIWAYPQVGRSASVGESVRLPPINAASVSATASRSLRIGGARVFAGARLFLIDVDGLGFPLSGVLGMSVEM